MIRHRVVRAVVLVAALISIPARAAQQIDLGPPRDVEPGVRLYHVTDPALLTPVAPLSAWLLQLDPAHVSLKSVLANDEIMGTETVAEMAARHAAAAAINAGFFLPNGDPAGVLALDRRLVSDTRRPRGAVGVVNEPDGPRLIFARLRASMTLRIHGRWNAKADVPVDGVDTTRARGKLMLFTPSYHADTDTAPGGTEWAVAGKPLRVKGARRVAGKTPIPPDGFVLSFGGTALPAPLGRLKSGTRVTLSTRYEPVEGGAAEWERARDIVGGAGLLIRDGADVTDWTMEQLNEGFATNRHPRTMIGTARDGSIWLVVVDGRQPQLSAGMTLEELRALAHRLDLRDALNLDGGGSTTMWVKGAIVNSPSDAAGPRKVSDALLVFPVSGAALR